MALQKSIELGNGFSANYWKIARYDIQRNFVRGGAQVRIFVVGWKDAQACADNKTAVDKVFSFIIEDVEAQVEADEVNITWCYNQVKLQPEFEGATDILPN